LVGDRWEESRILELAGRWWCGYRNGKIQVEEARDTEEQKSLGGDQEEKNDLKKGDLFF
jgi:hypothetical protein